MLVLSRKVNEEIIIGGNIRVLVVEVRGSQVRLGFEAPREVSIVRQEIHGKQNGGAVSQPIDVLVRHAG